MYIVQFKSIFISCVFFSFASSLFLLVALSLGNRALLNAIASYLSYIFFFFFILFLGEHFFFLFFAFFLSLLRQTPSAVERHLIGISFRLDLVFQMFLRFHSDSRFDVMNRIVFFSSSFLLASLVQCDECIRTIRMRLWSAVVVVAFASTNSNIQ